MLVLSLNAWGVRTPLHAPGNPLRNARDFRSGMRPLMLACGLLAAASAPACAGAVEVPLPEDAFGPAEWTVTGSVSLPSEALEEGDLERLRITGEGALHLGPGAVLTAKEVALEGKACLEVDGTEAWWDAPGSRVLISDEAILRVDGGGEFLSEALETRGGTIEVTGTARQAAGEDGVQNAAGFGTLRVRAGTTRLAIGGADRYGLDDDTALSFGRARAGFRKIVLEDGARLQVEIGQGGRLHWGGDFWGNLTDQVSDGHPDSGTLAVTGGGKTLLPGMYFTVGEGSATAFDRGLNLLVNPGGMIELDGPDSRLVLGEGTHAHFEPGSVIWVLDEVTGAYALSAADAGDGPARLDGRLGFSEDQVTGFENLEILFGEDRTSAYCYFNEEGRLVYLLQAPDFKGPFGPMLEAVWRNRQNVLLMTDFYRKLLHRDPATAGENLAAIALATTVNGTRERMAAQVMQRSVLLSDALRTLELRGSVPPARDGEPGLLARHMPEVMKAVPIFLDVSAARSHVGASASTGSEVRRRLAVLDETVVRAGFVLGRNDWRFGLEGLFSDASQRREKAGTSFRVNGFSSEMSGVTAFVRHRHDGTEFIADFGWLESADKARVPVLGNSVSTEDAKRTLWTAGVLFRQEVAAWERFGGWRLDAFAGLRGTEWKDAQAVWSAQGGEVLRTREKGGFGASATLGAALEGGTDLHYPGLPGIIVSRLPTRIDCAANGALHAGTFPGGSMTVSLPAAQGVRASLPVEKPSGMRFSAGLILGLQFPSTRLEVSGTTFRAGSAYRTHAVSARLSWRFNE